jgi:hypothetical protein
LHKKPKAAVRAGAFMRTGPREEEEEEECIWQEIFMCVFVQKITIRIS